MGTRNLTVVVLDGEYKVAQYCQWDGYPSGVGLRVLDFIKNQMNVRKFKKALKGCSFVEDSFIENAWVKCEQNIEMGSNTLGETVRPKDVGSLFNLRHPEFNRDTGPEILKLIQALGPLKLQNSINFAGDSLFCEWVYVLDLDKKVLEVYNGYTKKKSKGERFSKLKGQHGSQPIRLLKKFTFKSLTRDKLLELED